MTSARSDEEIVTGRGFKAGMRQIPGVRRFIQAIALATACWTVCGVCEAQQSQRWQRAVELAERQSPAARIVVIDVATGRLLASHRLEEAARTLAAPGSTLKPLILYSLIHSSQWDPRQRITCNRRLVVAGHGLACPHPQSPPFDARQALTWSCNSYFAAVGRTLVPGQLDRILRPTGLLSVTGLAPREATDEFRGPVTQADEQLAVLGLANIRVSPLELAEAYSWLALRMAAHPDSRAAQVVSAGLRDSSSFGMAGEANLGGLPVAGKTGTAEDANSARTHGWFVGLAPAAQPEAVLAVFVPSGRGADAAHVAGAILESMRRDGLR